jgi:glycosyltransferase involved in cell wall biosynthesis
LFAGADAFIYPTLFEGFGMTLLEAMAAGLPVACSDIEPLRSIAGQAALLFNPQDTREIEQALFRITDEEGVREGLRRAGPKRASAFTWEETARATMEILVAAASGNMADGVAAGSTQ